MQVNSLVKCMTSFDQLRIEWNIDYPYKDDILTVSSIEPHSNAHCRKAGINLLWFYEKPGIVGICDKNIKRVWNFKEIQPPMEISIEDLINKKYEKESRS